MSNQPSRTEHLFQKMLLGECSPQEMEELHALLNENGAEETLEAPMKEIWDAMAVYPDNIPSEKMYGNIQAMTQTGRVRNIRRWLAAASVAVLLGVGGYLIWKPAEKAPLATAAPLIKDVAPGKNGAILTLADGSQVVLDSVADGQVAAQKGARAVMRNGRLSYENTGGEAVFNTISIPRGRQFQVLLPDGTKMLLNSASSVTYPTVFNGRERRVEISGEAYFEVTPSARQPFIVNAGGTEVMVLGTSFNIHAYGDEPAVTTTLTDGAVKVRSYGIDQLLAPGEKAIGQNGSLRKEKADVAQATAWTRGLFSFDNKSMAEVLRELARWYDLEIVYKGRLPDIRFGGEIERNLNLSQVTRVLEKAGLHCRLEEGRKLVVYP